MKKTIKIKGMMCAHCEARVKKILEEIDGVINVIVSHTEGIAIVSMEQMVSDDYFTKVITDNGYEVVEILSK